MPDKSYFVDVKQYRTGWVRFEFKYNSDRKEFLKAIAANNRTVNIELSEYPEDD